MGGKSKQAQRTKNNARPSSSGRSAELLGTFGTGAVGVGGGTALFPTLAAGAAPDATLSPNLALCIKKLNKKDPITKTKALQELNELVQNSKVDDVVAMLPNWTYFYKSLTVDPDRKVRELTQVCHGSIVGACGRRVAPHLKALLPSWLAAQHDEHAPARSRAQLTLHNTFPENKLPEAISFCKTEVLTHMVDNLLDSNAAVNKKLALEEERVAAATRVSCGALGGLRSLAQHLPAAHSDWLWAELASLLGTGAFWKLASHSAPEVRAAWYSCVGALAARFGAAWGAAHGPRALKVALHAKETGNAAHQLWLAILQMIQADPEWYSRLDKKELVCTRLVEAVSGGGWGAARALWEVVPALLALLPPELLGEQLCDALFDACFTGLEKRHVMGSKSERAAWIHGAGECVRVLAERADLPGELARGALARWLRALLARTAPDTRAPLLHALAHTLTRWVRLPRLELLVRGFWQSVASAAADQLAQLGPAPDPRRLDDLLQAHVLLLVTLHQALQEEPKERKGVKFSNGPEPESEESCESAESSPSPGSPGSPGGGAGAGAGVSARSAARLLRHQLCECARRVCALYAAAARAQGPGTARALLAGLLPLLQLMPTADMWTAMAGALTTGSASPFALWEVGLRPWLSAEQSRCEAAVQVAFLLLPSLSEPEQAAVFTDIQKMEAAVCDWALPLAAQCAQAAALSWLRSGCARAALLRAARAALAGHTRAHHTLLACLTPTDSGEMPAGAETVSEVVQLVSYVVQSASGAGEGGGARDGGEAGEGGVASEAGEGCGGAGGPALRLGARLATLLAARAAPPALADLLAALLQHDLNTASEESESAERDSAVRAAWRDGVRVLPADTRAPLLQRLVRLLREHAHTQSNELCTERIVRCASLGAVLAGAVGGAEGGAGDVTAVTAQLLADPAGAAAHAHAHALRLDIVNGDMNCLFHDHEPVAAALALTSELSPESLLPFLRACVLRAAFLRALGERSARSPLEAPEVRQEFATLLHHHAVVRALVSGYAFSPVYELLFETDRQLTALIAGTCALAPERVLRRARAELVGRAADAGLYWAYAAALHCPGVTDLDCDNLTGDGFFHGIQAQMRISKDSVTAEALSERLSNAHALMVRSLCAAHAQPGPAQARAEPPAVLCDPPSADVIINAYYCREETMLYDTDISAAGWCSAVCAAGVADYLRALVAAGGWTAPAHHWDFITISLCSLLASLDRSKHAWGTTQVAMVSRAVLQLLSEVVEFIRAVPSEALRRQPSEHVAALPREWADVFEPTVTHHVFSLLLHILEGVEGEAPASMSAARARVVAALCGAVRAARWGALDAAARAHCPLERVARTAAAALAAPAHHAYKYLAHCTLAALLPDLVEEDVEKLQAWSAQSGGEESEGVAPAVEGGEGGEGGGGGPPLALDYVEDALGKLLELMEAALADLRVGWDTCSTAPGSDTHGLALGLLLLAEALGGLARPHPPHRALHYAERVRARRHVERLLPIALRLVPADVAAYATDPATSAPPPKDAADYFLQVKQFSIDEPSVGGDVGSLACRALFVCVSGVLAGSARGWRGAAGGREARALARLVRAYVAPALVRAQLRAVAERAPTDLPDAEVAVHWSSGEVTCCVYVEERRVEMSVALSAEHPLSLPRVTAPPPHQHSPAPSTHWLAVYLAYQNGSLLSALRMWIAAVSARVEAAPQCYICYCRLHPASGRLPSVPCHQCKNKFHPTCLRKWFTSSNKSNCPLCRAAF